MGIKGIFKTLEEKGYTGDKLHFPDKRFKGKTFVVDGCSTIHKFSSKPEHGGMYGGNFHTIFQKVREYVTAFHNAGINLIVVVDGAVESSKLDEWSNYRKESIKKRERFRQQVLAAGSAGCPPGAINSKYVDLPLGKLGITEAFYSSGCEVIVSVGEADKEVAEICHKRNCAGVISSDSDFIALKIPLLIREDSVKINKKGRIFATGFYLNKITRLLSVSKAFLPL